MRSFSCVLSAGFALLAASVLPASAQLILTDVGGTIEADNYGTLPGTSAFALDVIPAGTHSIEGVRDGAYGNPVAWIGNSENSFVGLNFGATALPLARVAWGRDNTAQFFDRSAGAYALHYTQVPNPGVALGITGDPATGWAPIGTTNYVMQGDANSSLSMSSRHGWSFPPVNATGIRLTAPGNSFANGAGVDELEAYAVGKPYKFSLITTGGTMDAATNIGLTSTAFAKDLINGGAFPAHSSITNVNDGFYGNDESWIGDSAGSFVGLNFNGSVMVDRFAFGRDNTGAFEDRSGGTYLLQYTNVANPDAATADGDWTDIGYLYYDHNGFDSADRHEYSFDAVTATGLRLVVGGNGIGNGLAVDELEVYAAVPEPGAIGLLVLAAGALVRRGRRRVSGAA